ncbi:1-acyl-sn-glycerol-3-phosphate acyltransferase delta isoform X1 [Phaenicophaeus curvirostris]|uniref:1-acyl-sn-glycerol-3-phosphate acyltransferase delta isoform X1 n=1 Tax=Phaenicophaeus curvirostris TaxID=33595 RepID=UPI0037F0B9D7
MFSIILLIPDLKRVYGGNSLQTGERDGRETVEEMVMLLEWWSGTDCTLYTDPESYNKYGKENAIVILNHNFEIDFLCGWNFCERFGVLGSSKVLAKKELSYMPIIGWMWYFLEIVFCKRKWEEDRKTVMQKLLNLRDYPENFWFLIHCEGTRFTEQKHQISMQVAEAKGLPKLKYHLLPRTKGFAVTVQCLRNVVSAVYDSTLNFRNNENPTLLGVLNGKKYQADLYVRQVIHILIPFWHTEMCACSHSYTSKEIFLGRLQTANLYQLGFSVMQIKTHKGWQEFLVKFCDYKYVGTLQGSPGFLFVILLFICVSV